MDRIAKEYGPDSMMSPIVLTMVALFSLPSVSFAQGAAREFLDGYRETFNTQGHPKAKGVHFRISYPGSWAALEGERPDVVQKFVSEGGRGPEIALIVTKSLPPDTIVTRADMEELFASDLRDFLPRRAELINARRTEIEGLPAGMVEFSLNRERAGMTFNMLGVMYIFIHNSVLTTFMCQTYKGENTPRRGNLAKERSLKILCGLMANSIVIPDLWTDTP